MRGKTYASNNVEEVISIRLGKPTRRVHFVNEERDGSSAEFFDEEMAEKVIVLGEVAHVHYFCRTPEHGPGGVGERSHGGRREKERIRRGIRVRPVFTRDWPQRPQVSCNGFARHSDVTSDPHISALIQLRCSRGSRCYASTLQGSACFT
jgi:hypothetical protein